MRFTMGFGIVWLAAAGCSWESEADGERITEVGGAGDTDPHDTACDTAVDDTDGGEPALCTVTWGEGSVDGVQTFVDGRIVSAVAYGFDGAPSRRETWTYHANGEIHEYWRDHDGDGQGVFLQAFDEQGRHLRQGTDEDGDGDLDGSWYAFTYDGDVQTRSQYEGDVLIGLVRTVYDDAGRILRIESDDGADGSLDATDVRVYDTQGNLIRREIDNPAGGPIEEVSEFVYEYDDLGRRVRLAGSDVLHEWFYEGDSMLPSRYERTAAGVDWYETWTYDDQDRVLLWEQWLNGHLYELDRFAYDGDVLVLEEHIRQSPRYGERILLEWTTDGDRAYDGRFYTDTPAEPDWQLNVDYRYVRDEAGQLTSIVRSVATGSQALVPSYAGECDDVTDPPHPY